jgi:hypothetical protein
MRTYRELVGILGLLVEGKLDDLRGRYEGIGVGHDPYGEIKRNVENPFDDRVVGDKKDELIDKIHSYIPGGNVSHTKWAIDRYHAGDYKQEDLGQLHSTLSLFNRNRHLLSKKNINQYRNLGELNDEVSRFRGSDSDLSLPEQKRIISSGSDLVHDVGGVKVYKLHGAEDSDMDSEVKDRGREACKLLGSSTWCISQKDDKENLFGHSGYGYNKPTYVIHLPHEEAPYRKIGYIHDTSEFQDENNHKIEGDKLKNLVGRNKELSRSLSKIFSNHIDQGDNIDDTLETAHTGGFLDNEFKSKLSSHLEDSLKNASNHWKTHELLSHANKYNFGNGTLHNQWKNDASKNLDSALNSSNVKVSHDDIVSTAYYSNHPTDKFESIDRLHHAHQYGYTSPAHQKLIKSLSDELSNKIQKKQFNNRDLETAKNHGYLNNKHKDLITHAYGDYLKSHGILGGSTEHEIQTFGNPELYKSIVDKHIHNMIDSDKLDWDLLDNASNHGYITKDHINKLKQKYSGDPHKNSSFNYYDRKLK